MVQVVSILEVPKILMSVSFQPNDVSGAQYSELLSCTLYPTACMQVNLQWGCKYDYCGYIITGLEYYWTGLYTFLWGFQWLQVPQWICIPSQNDKISSKNHPLTCSMALTCSRLLLYMKQYKSDRRNHQVTIR